ncbi:nucleoplasmin-like protein ANO39 [Aedes albopictus]|uniref:Uncharacterized protein n=1 Tax=Aedes albopictus TaxID=7160 RepID=A0ABM1ZYE0_AEDAL
MRLGAKVIYSLSLLVLVCEASVIYKNECDCKRKVMKAAPLPPPDFHSIKQCEETKPTDLHPIKDMCSCVNVANVRPACNPLDDVPKFAPSTSCECGYDDCKPPPKKYPADVISQHLAVVAARKKTISETDLHFHRPPIKVPPCPKEVLTVPEELLYKMNRQPIELKPPKRKYIPRVDLSEEDHQPCQPEKQYYSDICYGKIEPPNPDLEQVKQEEIPCKVCTDNHTEEEEPTDCPCETEEDCESDEETPDEADEDEDDAEEDEEEEEGEDADSNEGAEDDASEEDSGEEETYRKRSIRPGSFGKQRQSKRKIQ